jgi:hypothetical protein
LRREYLYAGCRKLYCKGKTVQPVAYLGYGGSILVGYLEVGLGIRSPLYEETYRLILGQLL